MIKTELYLGRAKRVSRFSSEIITDEAFSLFLRNYVAPRVPGFTVLHGQGYWNGVSEPASVLVVIREETDFEFDILDGIAADYRRAFNQQSVLRVDTPVSVETL